MKSSCSFFLLFVCVYACRISAQTNSRFTINDSLMAIELAKERGIHFRDFAEFIEGQKLLKKETSQSLQNQARYSSASTINAGPCTNMDFENGNTSGWVQSNGYNPLFNATGCCNFTNQIDQAIVTGTLNDQFGGFPTVFPGGGNFSLKVGSSTTGGRADRIEQTFFVNATNSIFKLNFAAVVNDGGQSHTLASQPRITIAFYDTLGNIANCTNAILETVGSPGFQTSTLTANGTPVYYKPWSSLYWNLSSHIGENLTFKLTVYDCGPSGHFSYVYIDGSCTASIIQGGLTKCSGDSVALCAPNGYQNPIWIRPTTTIDSSACIYPSTSGIYTCQVAPANNCPFLPFTYSVTVLPKPQLSIFVSDTSSCTFLHNFSATTSISNASLSNVWSFGNNQFQTGNTASFTYSTIGSYVTQFKSTASNGCSDSIQQVIQIYSPPISSFVGGTVCAGNVFTLTNLSSVPSGSIISNLWNTGNGTLTNNQAIFTSTAIGINTISLTVVSDKNCSVTSTNNVLVNAQPQLSFATSTNYCSGSVLTLTNTSTILFGSVNYTWTISPNVTLTNASPTYTLGQPGTLSVTLNGLSEQGCAATLISTLGVLPLPTVSVNSGSICANQSFILNPTGATQYSFTSGSAIVSPLQTSTVAATGWSSQGCQAASAAISTITVYPLPTVTAASGLICMGKSFTLQPSGAQSYTYSSGTAVVSPSSSSTYSIWGSSSVACVSSVAAIVNVSVQALPILSVNSGSICSGQVFSMQVQGANQYTFSSNSPTVTPLQNSTYTIVGADTFGCKSTITSSVQVFPKPNLIVLQSRTSMCEFQPVTFTVSGAPTFTWFNGTNSNTLQVNAQVNQNYFVYAQNSFGCSDTAQANLNIQPNPTVTIVASPSAVCIGQQCLLTASGALTYYWNPSNTTNVMQFIATPSNTFTVIGKNAFGCTTNQSFVLNVNECLSQPELHEDKQFKIYPVPFSQILEIELRTHEDIFFFEIFNELGQSMTGERAASNKVTLPTADWATGVYYCKLHSGRFSQTIKLLKL